ncbi:hypothetical protein ACXHMN_23285 [Rhizobium sp. LEGMi12c]
MNSTFQLGLLGISAWATGMLVAVGVAVADSQTLSAERLLDVCSSRTIAEVTVKGGRLGWEVIPSTDPSTVSWRQSFISYNGGSVDVVGWRKRSTDNEETISFWVAQGPNAHKACSYSIKVAGRLLDDLTESLGRPSQFDKDEVATTAFWKRGSGEISFSQVGSTATVVISP